MKRLAAIILAAGKGTRMKSSLPKVLHEIAGWPMVRYPIECARKVECRPLLVVVGHGGDKVGEHFGTQKGVQFVEQLKQLGSAHAVLAAEKALKDFKGDVLILSGDVPLIQQETIQKVIEFHRVSHFALTLVSFRTLHPEGYGRVIRNGRGEVLKVVEETDLTEHDRRIDEVNGGLYVAKAPLLFQALKKVKPNPVKKEYYFTDLPALLRDMGEEVGGFHLNDPTELMGVNTCFELAVAEKVMQERLQKKWMLEGVTIVAPHRTLLHQDVEIKPDTVLHPDVALLGKSRLGEACLIEQGAVLQDVELGDHVTVKAYSVLEKSEIGSQAVVGPFARVRPDSKVSERAHIGNFVELKKTWLGEGSKANHLSYLGDAVIGKGVNIGAGTITCNYNGKEKFPTKIEEGVFVGSDTQFVAPVKVGKNATIGAGTTVTKDVPAEALALSRVEQKNILGYSRKKKKIK